MDSKATLDSLFKPQSIALIGAAHTEEKLGGVILKSLLKFKGRVYPVNPKYKELMGIKAYPSATDIPEPVDLAIIMRPAAEVPEIISSLRDKTKVIIIMSSGFAEVGENALQDEIKKIGKESGFRIVGPNCMGLYNPYHKLDTFFLPQERLRRPKPGNVSIVSQSGAILSCIMEEIRKANTGVSKIIGYGNAADVDESDIYDYLAEDEKTDVVISYIESVGDGRKFVEKARALSKKKALLVLKSGKSPGGEVAAFSHTGRLAGRYEVFHSILKQFGIQEAGDFEELLDATKALSYQSAKCRDAKKGCNSVLIITNGGGSGVLAVDECIKQRIEVPKMSGAHKERLRKVFPPFYGINNPVDLTAQVRDEDYAVALAELKDDYDGFLLIALPNVMGITEKLGRIMEDAVRDLNKPVVFYVSEGGISKKLIALLERAKIPVYPSPERAVRAIRALLIHT